MEEANKPTGRWRIGRTKQGDPEDEKACEYIIHDLPGLSIQSRRNDDPISGRAINNSVILSVNIEPSSRDDG